MVGTLIDLTEYYRSGSLPSTALAALSALCKARHFLEEEELLEMLKVIPFLERLLAMKVKHISS